MHYDTASETQTLEKRDSVYFNFFLFFRGRSRSREWVNELQSHQEDSRSNLIGAWLGLETQPCYEGPGDLSVVTTIFTNVVINDEFLRLCTN